MTVTRTSITRTTSRGLALLLLVALAACRGEGASDASPPQSAGAEAPALQGPVPQHGGHVFALGPGDAWIEFVYDEGWGTLSIHLTDGQGAGLEFDEAPYLNLLLEDAPRRVPGTRDLDILSGDTAWTFEDDGLLGETERARFHLVFRGKHYVPPFAHSHQPHAGDGGHAHGAATEETTRALPPGVSLALSPLATLVVDHNQHWGIVHLRLVDHELRPRGYDRPPLIHARLGDDTLRLGGQRGSDGAWYYEHDALLGEPDRARLQVQVDGTTYIPEFPYRPHQHDHSHVFTKDHGIGGEDHRLCDPRLCPLAPGAEFR